MELLKMLQTIRTPALDVILGLVTRLGEETALMVAAMALLWCFNKERGFQLMLAGLAGTAVNQLLKAIFLIPRPWILDPTFTIVEAAREAATGYSFPSGHTQSAAIILGLAALWCNRKWLKAALIALVALVGFSRMYLGVHTPLDVGVSLVTGAVTVVFMDWVFRKAEADPKAFRRMTVGCLAMAVVLLAYLYLAPKRPANDPEFDAHGIKAGWTLMGTTIGMLAAWWYDREKLHFDTSACWWAQLCKLAIGLGLVMGVRLGMKPVLQLIFGDAIFTTGIRYCLMALVGGIVWPMSFKWWQKRA